MTRLRFLTAGESHGPGLTGIVEGLPAGLALSAATFAPDLARRQAGYGRGGRQKIEKDAVVIQGGVRAGLTTGAPVALWIENRDFANWRLAMDAEPGEPTPEREAALALRRISKLRPGHADFAGAMKYDLEDVRDVLERASARETAMRVAVGAIAKALLAAVGVELTSHVLAIGPAAAPEPDPALDVPALRALAEPSPVRCADPAASEAMVEAIDQAKAARTSLGGIVEVRTSRLPVGLGSYAQWDARLDGRLAQALMSIPSVKGVGFGLGFEAAARDGRTAHDPIGEGYFRETNRAGGLEGGVTNGEPLVARMAFKPIATQPVGLPSRDWASGEETAAHFERADACAVPAGGVVAEAMVAWVLADALLDKLGGDSMAELEAHAAATLAAQAARRARAQGVE